MKDRMIGRAGVFLFSLLFLLVLVASGWSRASALTDTDITAPSAILLEPVSGQVLMRKTVMNSVPALLSQK